jgi:type I restriction enzyme, S subunit
VVEGHGNPREVGRVAVWDGSLRPCVHQNHLIRVRCGDICRPQFLSAYLNSEAGRRTIIRSGKTTSGLNTISTSNVKQTEIFLPPVALQTVFEQRVGLLEQLTTHQTFAEGMGEAVAQSIRARVLGR